MKTTKKSAETLTARHNRVKRRYISAAAFVLVSVALACPALAAGGGGGDPLSIVNNLSDFIFSIIKALKGVGFAMDIMTRLFSVCGGGKTEVLLPDFGDEEEQRPIGIWGQRRLWYIREHKKVFTTSF